MENKLMKIEPSQLEEVVKNSGLQIQEGEEIKKSYIPFLNQLAEIQEQSNKINFENPAQIDEMISRELRLKTVKIRTGASQLKDDRKRIHLLKGNLEQAAFNLISASCKLAEEAFTQVEKAREIAAEKAAQELKIERLKELEPYNEFVIPGTDFAHISEDSYQKIFTGAKLQFEYRIEQQKKAEAERIAREKEQERIRLENEKLKKEAEEKEKQLQAEREKAEKERKAAEEKARKERELIEAKAAEEKRRADEKLRIEREKANEKLNAEKAAKSKLEAEIKAKQLAEEKARKEAEAKILADQKAKALAEKKALAAPDKVKLIELARIIEGLLLPELKIVEGKEILANIKILLMKTASYIREKTLTL